MIATVNVREQLLGLIRPADGGVAKTLAVSSWLRNEVNNLDEAGIKPLAVGTPWRPTEGVEAARIGLSEPQALGTPQNVQAEVRQRIDEAGAGGGLLLSPTHVLAPEVPLENIRAMFDAAVKYGRP